MVEDPSLFSGLVLEAQYDDGFKVWINGNPALDANISTGEVPFNRTAASAIENINFVTFDLSSAAGKLVAGTNLIAIQAHNSSLTNSSDFFLDVRLRAQTGPANRGPTPGRRNSVSRRMPPQIRQVEHKPKEPASGQPVRISAKITDPDGVTNVALQYQVVDPGKYIELTDAAYATNWVSVAMHDDGVNGDAAAGDDVFAAELPAALQVHRRLIRYRITAVDGANLSVRVPYADDPEPNFAYFVYDGVPAWRGSGAAGRHADGDLRDQRDRAGCRCII